MGALALIVFSGAGVTAISVIVAAVAPQWRRILNLALGRVELPTAAADRWRRVHLEADARAPFQEIRATTPWRGVFGRGRR